MNLQHGSAEGPNIKIQRLEPELIGRCIWLMPVAGLERYTY